MRVALCLLLGLSSCVTVDMAKFVPTNPATVQLYRRQAADVAIVSTAPQRPFIEIGFVEGAAPAPEMLDDAPRAVLAEMREKAAEQGCQALLITTANDVAVRYHGACLVFTDPEGLRPPETTPKSAPPVFFFRDAEGNIHRVVGEDARQAVKDMGWTETGAPG